MLNQSYLRRHKPIRSLVVAFALGLSFSSLHCSRGDAGGPDSGAGGNSGDPRGESELAIGEGDSGSDGNELPLSPLCGVGSCVPDDARACPDPDPYPDTDSEGYGGEGGANVGGAAGGMNVDPERRISCQVVVEEDCEGSGCSLARSCEKAGRSADGDPCVAASDCGPGLACVGEGVSGVCRPYCCRGTEASCNSQSFCDERRLLETPEAYVPVCLPLDNCPLSDPFPCGADRTCSCQGNKACLIVRADGKTACTIPGAGQAGDSCNDQETAACAHGFVCGPNQICMQICSTMNEESGCPTGRTCLKQSALGGELGICIASASGN